MHEIANITATYNGDTVEDCDDVTRGSLATLLDSGDEIVIHEVHDEEQVEDLKERYPEWEEKVELAGDETDNNGDDEDDESLFASDDSECRHIDCGAVPEVAAECDTGQTKYYCDEHAGGTHAGHAYVEEWRAM